MSRFCDQASSHIARGPACCRTPSSLRERSKPRQIAGRLARRPPPPGPRNSAPPRLRSGRKRCGGRSAPPRPARPRGSPGRCCPPPPLPGSSSKNAGLNLLIQIAHVRYPSDPSRATPIASSWNSQACRNGVLAQLRLICNGLSCDTQRPCTDAAGVTGYGSGHHSCA